MPYGKSRKKGYAMPRKKSGTGGDASKRKKGYSTRRKKT